MKKNLIKVTIILSMLILTLIPLSVSAATSGTCGSKLTWTLSDSGTLTISGTGAMADYMYDDAPWSREYVENVVINNGVTSIGNYAFCDEASLTNITIPNSVTSIGKYAFAWCEKLKSITIPGSVKTIGDSAFLGCASIYGGLNSVTLGNGVTTIGEYAFGSCYWIRNITIPSSVTSIGESAFNDCWFCTNIEVCASNSYYSSEDGVLFNKDKTTLVHYPMGKEDLKTYIIPDSVTTLGEYAFFWR